MMKCISPAFSLTATVGAIALAAACAPPPPPTPGPAAAAGIAALQARAARGPGDVEVAVRLGAAYRDAGRLPDARRVLEAAAARSPRNAGAALFLGLTCEDEGDAACARTQYGRWLRLGGGSAPLKAELRGRLAALERAEMQAAVRQALAQEARLARTPPTPGTVAVFPFLVRAEDPALAPLDRALADFLVTDLGQTGRLRVLERARVQELTDEMRLADRGAVDPATAARGGHLLGAADVVQGRVTGTERDIRMDAAVARVGAAAADTGALPVRSGALAGLFGLEKQLAVDVHARLGVALTPAERARLLRRPTDNLQAVLAYGRGLRSADEGDFAEAVRHFLEAASLDPGFAAARAHAQASAAAARAAGVTTAQLARQGSAELAGTNLAGVQALVARPGARDPFAEATGVEGFRGRPSDVQFTFPRP
jgi:tetratricopeptide (TPR) repeat protein